MAKVSTRTRNVIEREFPDASFCPVCWNRALRVMRLARKCRKRLSVIAKSIDARKMMEDRP